MTKVLCIAHFFKVPPGRALRPNVYKGSGTPYTDRDRYIYCMWGPQRTEKQSGVLTPWVSISVQRGSSSSVSSAAETSLNCEREKERKREREKKERVRGREREKTEKGEEKETWKEEKEKKKEKQNKKGEEERDKGERVPREPIAKLLKVDL